MQNTLLNGKTGILILAGLLIFVNPLTNHGFTVIPALQNTIEMTDTLANDIEAIPIETPVPFEVDPGTTPIRMPETPPPSTPPCCDDPLPEPVPTERPDPWN
jgi:hypothetical protein